VSEPQSEPQEGTKAGMLGRVQQAMTMVVFISGEAAKLIDAISRILH